MANTIHSVSLSLLADYSQKPQSGSCNPAKLCVRPKCKFYKLSEFSSLKNQENVFWVPGKTCPFVLLQTINVIYSGHCSDFLSIHAIVCHNQSFMCIRSLCLGGNRLASHLSMKHDSLLEMCPEVKMCFWKTKKSLLQFHIQQLKPCVPSQ